MILRCVTALLFSALIGTCGNVYAKHKVVLVTDRNCPLTQLSSLDLRKIYFGFRVEQDNRVLRGIINRGDDQLEQIFLQSIVAMSKKSYMRRSLWLRLNYGNPKLLEFYLPLEFTEQAKKRSCSLTYMWLEDVPHTGDLKVLDLLWQSD